MFTEFGGFTRIKGIPNGDQRKTEHILTFSSSTCLDNLDKTIVWMECEVCRSRASITVTRLDIVEDRARGLAYDLVEAHYIARETKEDVYESD